MKKLFLTVFPLILPMTTFASGPYDGVYSVNFSGFVTNYVTIHEYSNTNQVIAAVLDPHPETPWIALSGTRNGNTVILSTISGASAADINLTVNADFNSSLATIISCVDGAAYVCKFPAGVTLNMNRIF